MPTVEIVVARYNEDVNWCKDFKYPCIIYSKTEFDSIGLNCISIPVDDQGREVSTWLMHIINNYEKLADFTVFLQGKYIDHCEDLEKKLRFDQPFTWLTNEMLNQAVDSIYMGLKYGDAYSELFPLRVIPPGFTFGRGGLFMVSKELIQSHPIEYYQTILNFFKNSYPDKIWSCYLERFWELIFKEN